MMATGALNGWTAEKLYALARTVDETKQDVGEIKTTLAKMQSDETQSLRNRVKELEGRPYRHLRAIGVPFLCACIPAAVVLLSHA